MFTRDSLQDSMDKNLTIRLEHLDPQAIHNWLAHVNRTITVDMSGRLQILLTEIDRKELTELIAGKKQSKSTRKAPLQMRVKSATKAGMPPRVSVKHKKPTTLVDADGRIDVDADFVRYMSKARKFTPTSTKISKNGQNNSTDREYKTIVVKTPGSPISRTNRPKKSVTRMGTLIMERRNYLGKREQKAVFKTLPGSPGCNYLRKGRAACENTPNDGQNDQKHAEATASANVSATLVSANFVEPVSDPQPGPSRGPKREPKSGPSKRSVPDLQSVTSRRPVLDPQPGPSRLPVSDPQPGPSRRPKPEPQSDPDHDEEGSLLNCKYCQLCFLDDNLKEHEHCHRIRRNSSPTPPKVIPSTWSESDSGTDTESLY